MEVPARVRPFVGPAVALALVLAVALPEQQACFALDAAPVAPGQVLLYELRETTGAARKSWTLRAVVLRAPEERLALEFRGAPGEPTPVVVDERLRPVEPGEVLEVRLTSGEVFRPGLMWLAPDERRVAAMTDAGRVKELELVDGRAVWTVHGDDGGARHYEQETGLLSTFDVTVGSARVEGRRVWNEG